MENMENMAANEAVANVETAGSEVANTPINTDGGIEIKPSSESAPSADKKKEDTKIVSERIKQINKAHSEELKRRDAELNELKRLQSVLNESGFKGETPQDLIYEIMAGTENLSFDEVKNREERKKEKENSTREAIKKELIEGELKQLLDEAQKAIFANQSRQDLAAVKAAFPDVTAETSLDLGERFIQLMASGLFENAADAYRVVRFEEENAKNVKPPSTGSMATTDNTTEKEYYTIEEARRLTAADYKRDPSLFEKVKKSMMRGK